MRVLARGIAHGHSRMDLQFSRLRASLEGRTIVPNVNANVEEKIRADAVPENADECRSLRLHARISWQPDWAQRRRDLHERDVHRVTNEIAIDLPLGVAPASTVRMGVDQFPIGRRSAASSGVIVWVMGCSSVKLVGVRSPRERTTFEYSYDSFV
jgi:hypothetical protein